MGVCDEEMANMLKRLWPRGAFERALTLFFAMIILAFGITSFVNAPLSFDGSFYLFRVLDNHDFIDDLDRVIHIPLQVPVLAATYVTHDLHFLSLAFSAAYCSIPLLGLALSWIICRQRPSLFIWPAISICLAELPGRFFFINEQVMLATLFWPTLLMVLLGAPTVVMMLVAAITIVAAASQPVAAATLAEILLVALVSAIIRPQVREQSLWYALFLGLLLLERIVIPIQDWERKSFTLNVVSYSFYNAVWGWPLIATAFTMLAGLMCLFTPRRYPRIYLMVPLVLVGIALTVWALNPTSWDRCIDFRYWITPITLVLMAGAAVEELWLRRSSEVQLQEIRRYAIPLVGAIFLLVLSMQSVEWQMMNHRLRGELVNSERGCIPSGSLFWLHDTPLSHWGGTFNAIEVQGQKPATLLLPNELDCQIFATEGDAKLVDQGAFKFDRDIRGSWFDFDDAYRKAREDHNFY